MKYLKSLTIYLFLPALIAGLFIWFESPKIKTHGLNTDELIYLKRSLLFDKYIHGDFVNPIWDSWDSYDQPTLGNFAYALSIFDYAQKYGGYSQLLSQANLTTTYYPCNTSNSNSYYFSWGCLDGTSPQDLPPELTLTQTLLYRTRTVSLLVTALSLVLLYFLGTLLIHPLAGVFASVYLGFISPFGRLGVMAMLDPWLIFFSLLFTLSLFLFTQKSKPSWLFALLTGTFLGLSVSTKLVGGVGFIFLLFMLPRFKHLLLSLVAACLIFLLLNPFLWPQPLTRSVIMLELRSQTAASQQAANPQWALTETPTRALAVVQGIFKHHDLITLKTHFPLGLTLFLGGLAIGLISLFTNPTKKHRYTFTLAYGLINLAV